MLLACQKYVNLPHKVSLFGGNMTSDK